MIDMVLWYAGWVLGLAASLGFGAAALALAFHAGAAWRSPKEAEPDLWKWYLTFAILVGGFILLAERYRWALPHGE